VRVIFELADRKQQEECVERVRKFADKKQQYINCSFVIILLNCLFYYFPESSRRNWYDHYIC